MDNNKRRSPIYKDWAIDPAYGSKKQMKDFIHGLLVTQHRITLRTAKRARLKDKERLLEGVKRRIIYPEPMAEGSDVDEGMMAYNSALGDIEQLIKEIYE